MSMLNPYQHYAQNQVNTSTPEELTLMLYKGAVKFINLAIKGIENNNIQECNNNIVKAQSIYYELIATLDNKYPISQNLSTMYDYIIYRLTQANIKKDKEMLEEALGMANELAETWEQAMKLYRQSQAPAEWVK